MVEEIWSSTVFSFSPYQLCNGWRCYDATALDWVGRHVPGLFELAPKDDTILSSEEKTFLSYWRQSFHAINSTTTRHTNAERQRKGVDLGWTTRAPSCKNPSSSRWIASKMYLFASCYCRPFSGWCSTQVVSTLGNNQLKWWQTIVRRAAASAFDDRVVTNVATGSTFCRACNIRVVFSPLMSIRSLYKRGQMKKTRKEREREEKNWSGVALTWNSTSCWQWAQGTLFSFRFWYYTHTHYTLWHSLFSFIFRLFALSNRFHSSFSLSLYSFSLGVA
jgi:hypothetical protein